MSNVPGKPQTVLSASGAISAAPGLYHITKAGVAALTLANPDPDGIQMTLVDEGGHAHTITVPIVGSPPTAGLNGGTKSIITFNGTAGSSVELISRAGSWWTEIGRAHV